MIRGALRLAGRLLLLLVSLSFALAAVEGLSRVVFPIRAVPFLDEQGRAVDIRDGRYLLRPNLRVKQVAREFAVQYTTTPQGHRVPGCAANPEMVFIGDSFTFGSGVDDAETFVYLFCTANQICCANLGRAGIGTRDEIEILRSFLERKGWRPRRVRLVMFAMTGALMNGNDLTDNLVNAKKLTNVDTDSFTDRSPRNTVARWTTRFRYSLRRLSITRVALLYAGPTLRSRLTPGADAGLVREALQATRKELARLQALGRRYAFTYDVTVIHPMQDVLRGTDCQTLRAIRSAAPAGVAVRSTADVLRRDPAAFYYALDMHLNKAGHRAVANFLGSVERQVGGT